MAIFKRLTDFRTILRYLATKNIANSMHDRVCRIVKEATKQRSKGRLSGEDYKIIMNFARESLLLIEKIIETKSHPFQSGELQFETKFKV